MQVSHQFDVARPVQTVWDFFQDVPSVAQCLPGAELTEDKGDNVYAGKVSVKLGPLSATFEGEAKVTPDAVAKSGLIDGKGVDRRGGSRGQVKVTYQLVGSDAGTTVSMDADVTLSGAAAQFGRTGLINEMSNRLIGEFVQCVEGKLAATTVEEAQEIKAAEVKGITLFFQSLLTWLKRLFGRR
ncbi:MAG: SRPBCC family protein [Acidimicrobiia bacterium]|nr:SRPBCC family protein [Acidimicrobiia bacterium]MDH4306665.1 SRPBCC family protein [Acidimicrobiia bacterium]MDH5294639.1 SRPBCC family protein [Acidimicrobiia bacterium]